MRVITVMMTLIFASLPFASCEKAKEPEQKQPQAQSQPQNEPSEPQRTEPETQKAIIAPSPATGGTPTSAPEREIVNRYEEPAERDIKEMAEIMYKQLRRDIPKGPYPGDEGGYVYDLCAGMKDLWAAGNNKEYFTLILGELKNDKIPSVRACAADNLSRKAVSWYGRDEVQESMKDEIVPALKKALLDSNGEVKMKATGSLMEWEEYDVALPVFEERVKEGESNAFRHLSCEEKIVANYEQKTKRLFGVKGILRRALDSQFNEMRILAVLHLLDCGEIKVQEAEKIAIEILEMLKDKTATDYGVSENEQSDIKPLSGMNVNLEIAERIYRSDRRACDTTVELLARAKSRKGLAVLKYLVERTNKAQNHICGSYVKKSINKAVSSIELSGGDQ